MTLDVKFVNFHIGFLRDMKFHRDPNKKELWDPQFFDSLSYYEFLRISELQNLTTNDIILDTENKRLKIIIRCSKTDPFGKGEITYFYDYEKVNSPYKFYNILLELFENDQLIVDRNGSALRHHLNVILKKNGADPTQYS